MNITAQALQNKFQAPGKRKSRLSMPKVNPDPRPPNESNKNSGGGQDNQSKKNKPTKVNVKGVKSPFTSPTQPVGSNRDSSVPSPYANPVDPRDATYWTDLIKAQQERNFGLQRSDLEQTYSNTAFQEALGNLARQKPRDILSTKENANRGGAFYSSKTGESIGQIEQEYFKTQSGMERTKQQEDELRAIARKAIEQGYTVEEAAALARAADRAATTEIDRPPPVDTTTAELLARLLDPMNPKPGNTPKPNKPNKPDKPDKPNKPNKPNKPKKWNT